MVQPHPVKPVEPPYSADVVTGRRAFSLRDRIEIALAFEKRTFDHPACAAATETMFSTYGVVPDGHIRIVVAASVELAPLANAIASLILNGQHPTTEYVGLNTGAVLAGETGLVTLGREFIVLNEGEDIKHSCGETPSDGAIAFIDIDLTVGENDV